MSQMQVIVCPHCKEPSYSTLTPPGDDWCAHCGQLYDEDSRKPNDPEEEP